MKDKTRSEKSIKNAFVSFVYYIVINIFSFIMKILLTRMIGIEYAGLNSLLVNILGVLNIAELGLGVAVGYSLYKPLSKDDYNQINDILHLYKYLYRIIALFIAFSGIIVTLFIDKFVTSEIAISEIRICFLLYLFATVLSYLLTYINVLPSADQRNYIVVKIQNNGKIIKFLLQIIVIYLFKNFYSWLFVEIIITLLTYIYTNIRIKKLYPKYEEKCNKTFKTLLNSYKRIVKNIKHLFFHKIGGMVVYQTDIILISYYGTLTDSGIYSNYMLIYTLLTGLVEQVFNGVTGSIGNLIVEKKEKDVFNIWKDIYIVTLFITIMFGFLFYQLANPFISLAFGEEYILGKTIVVCIVVNTMFRIVKNPVDKFKEAYGIFWDYYSPIVESVINLVSSIILGMKFGIIGIVIGTIISNIVITFLWKPYVVFKYGFKQKFSIYLFLTFKYLLIGLCGMIISFYIIDFFNISLNNKVLELIILFAINGVISIIAITGCFMIDKDFKKVLNKYIKIMIKMMTRKTNKETT